MSFDQTISGASTNAGRSVVRIGKGAAEIKRLSLTMPATSDLGTDEGRKMLNDRLLQIEYELSRSREYEVSVPVKYAYATVDSGSEYEILIDDVTPVPGARLSLDKIGTWLLLMSVTIDAQDSGVVFTCDLAVDAEDEAQAKIQPCRCHLLTDSAGKNTVTGWALFTATSIPRLVSLYVRKASGAGASEIQEPTHIAAIWLSQWTAGGKRFGRQTATSATSKYYVGTDANGDDVTIHGEEARYPAADDPDKLAEPDVFGTLYD